MNSGSNNFRPNAPQIALPGDDPLAHIQSNNLIRSISAGWTDLIDLRLIVPVLAQTKIASSMHHWHHSSAASVARMQEYHDAEENQIKKYVSILESINISTLNEHKIPSYGKYFANSLIEFYKNAPDGEMLEALVHYTHHRSETIQTALIKSLNNGDSSCANTKEPLSFPATKNPNTMMLDGLIELHNRFYNDLYDAMRFNRMESSMHHIQSRKSLASATAPTVALYPGIGEIVLEHIDNSRNIEFSVERYPCEAEVLDPRVVRIPAGKYNNKHKHAHETLFYFMTGAGEILVNQTWIRVKAGDAVFSPRWAIHQTHNTGDAELILLAITDYHLTRRIYVGKYDQI